MARASFFLIFFLRHRFARFFSITFPIRAHLESSPDANGCGARRLRRFNVASPQINCFFHFYSDGNAA
jgi:hypothetical protein